MIKTIIKSGSKTNIQAYTHNLMIYDMLVYEILLKITRVSERV